MQNKKIGILTFHWGANFGGVLQAFALQTTLKELGYDVEIIDFSYKSHLDNFLLCFKTKSISNIMQRLKEHRKNKLFKPFRTKNLNLSKRLYTSRNVEREIQNYDVVICGSDQIWNPSTIKYLESLYFLPFNTKIVKKVSYAASLGTDQISKDDLEKITPFLNDFNSISVRENSAVTILQKVVKDTISLVPDPAMLINSIQLDKIVSNKFKEKDFQFFYILQNKQHTINTIKDYQSKTNSVIVVTKTTYFYGIEDWIGGIKYSSSVVTNSFHGVVFSVLYHKNFIAVPLEGTHKGMNDRINTLLKNLGLSDRIIDKYDENKIDYLLKTDINWEEVDSRLQKQREIGVKFLEESLV